MNTQTELDRGYREFYSGSGGEDALAHDFQAKTGWHMVWGSNNDGLNGDTWIVYRDIESLPKSLQNIVLSLERAVPQSPQPTNALHLERIIGVTT